MSDVDDQLTKKDKRAIQSLGLDKYCGGITKFSDETNCIKALQTQLLHEVPDKTCYEPTDVASPNHEPAALLSRDYGCCFDRARFIEKALQYYGFETRHIAELNTPLPFGLLEPGIPSHALSEVKTRRGWVAVDSLDVWMGLDERGRVYDTQSIHSTSSAESVDWQDPLPHNFEMDYTVIYGLYSRHGKFFPPYSPVPDVDWSQFRYNIWR